MNSTSTSFYFTKLSKDRINETIDMILFCLDSKKNSHYSKKEIEVWKEIIKLESTWNQNNTNITACITDNHTVGVCEISNDGFISKLYVCDNFKGLKIASFLLKSMELFANNLNLNEITVEADVDSMPFFKKKGFHLVKQQFFVYKGQKYPTLLLKKRIN